jgi:hypothetical protein
MENHHEAEDHNSEVENYNSYYLIPALIVGILTGCVLMGTVLFAILGGILGLLFGIFWINVIAVSSEEG